MGQEYNDTKNSRLCGNTVKGVTWFKARVHSFYKALTLQSTHIASWPKQIFPKLNGFFG